jgi:hypothetical protein
MKIKAIQLERYPLVSTYTIGQKFYLDGKLEYIIKEIEIMNKSQVRFTLEKDCEFASYDEPIYHTFTEITSEWVMEEKWKKEII